MHKFKIKSDFKPCGDQPAAIDKLVEGINAGFRGQLFWGLQVPGKHLQWQMSLKGCKSPHWLLLTIKLRRHSFAVSLKSFFPTTA